MRTSISGLVVACLLGCSATTRRDTRLAQRTVDRVDVVSRDAVAPADARVLTQSASRAPLNDRAICARPVIGAGRLLRRSTSKDGDGADDAQDAPDAPVPSCPEEQPMCDTVDRAPRGARACYVSNDHIAREERAIARANNTSGRPSGTPAATPWNRRTPPQYLDLVDEHLQLSSADRNRLAGNGFVAMERHRYDSYAVAFHEIFRQQLPVYVGVDAIMHAIFVAHSTALQSIEARRLRPALRRMLVALRSTLQRSRATMPAQIAQDLDEYLAVAHALLEEREQVSVLFGRPANAQALLEHATGSGLEEVTLFGRVRSVDFSQFSPRGHYTESVMIGDETVTLESYFRAMQWLSRTEFNLVSRGCQSSAPAVATAETPREALVALALANLVERAGQSSTLADFEQVYSVFGGKREDVPLPELSRIARERRIALGSADAFTSLRAGIGDRFRRTARIHFTPEGAGELPAIATMFGPRIVPDTAPLTGLVHDSVSERTTLSGVDVGYLLGHDRARVHLRGELARHPSLGAALDRGRAAISSAVRDRDDLYSRWLSAAQSLAAPRTGVWPSFASTDAFADYRLNASLVTYAQIRHNYVLLAGQGYDAYGCEIPDGYVEPAVETWDALLVFARSARAIDRGRAAFWNRMAGVLETLRTISLRERAGLPLTDAQKRWIGMVSEHIPAGGYGGDSGQPPMWTGWYFDLFADREIGAEKNASFIADYFTLTNTNQVAYLGARTPMLGVFVVDTNGPPRVMVGPIARGFEQTGPIEHRFTDEDSGDPDDDRARWRDSYTVRDAAALGEMRAVRCPSGQWRVALTGTEGQSAEFTLLDHHGDAVTSSARATIDSNGTAVAAFELARGEESACEGVRVRVTNGRDVRDATDPTAMRMHARGREAGVRGVGMGMDL